MFMKRNKNGFPLARYGNNNPKGRKFIFLQLVPLTISICLRQYMNIFCDVNIDIFQIRNRRVEKKISYKQIEILETNFHSRDTL